MEWWTDVQFVSLYYMIRKTNKALWRSVTVRAVKMMFRWLSRFVFALRTIYWFRPPFSSGISWISSMLDICSSCKRGLFWQIQGVGEWERNVSLYQHFKILLCFSRRKLEENKSKNLEGTSLKSVSLPCLFWDAVLAFVLFIVAMTGWDLLIGPLGHFF